ncbi:diacylglycerol kinase family protein [Streptomyces sp. FL07-04A]|uniref:diacylglycerol kinase family protein n=1 Tax=Streptomyces sp. FL07-04A TaxID=3028658 RepID=UPI0029A7D255|nr:diacylglycerol kinase family protein [Streptomyces sp. FL07-04A]MDX3575549.1 diacylglycerol kinase family protein [Streptomyces sp. FL07-04A]
MATFATSDQLLVIIDPVSRRADGESVRIAKDVLSAGAASTKVCVPEDPEEFARALARRGSRRPVVIGDDRALTRAVALLHRQRALAECVLSVVPVGGSLSLAHALGVPTSPVAAARAVLEGSERRLDLLVDDSDGVVLGALRIPAPPTAGGVLPADPSGRPWLQSLVRTLVPIRPSRPSRPSRPVAAPFPPGPARLRVEVDGTTLVDLDQPVEAVSVTPGVSGSAEVVVRPSSVGAEAAVLQAYGRTVTVSGADFRYRADAAVAGPVRRRTWTVRAGALALTLPATQ